MVSLGKFIVSNKIYKKVKIKVKNYGVISTKIYRKC